MKNKVEYENTKMSPIIFAVLLIIVLLMFAIGKKINQNRQNNNQTNQASTIVDNLNN